jgi:hypothetical protein
MEGRNSTVDGHENSAFAVRTGVDGSYAIALPKPGAYSARAVADGYITGDFSQFFQIGNRAPSTVTLHFDMVKPAAISGSVFDDETGKPIGGIQIAPRRAAYDRGRLSVASPVGVHPAVTDSNGAFHLEGLMPGAYFLELNPSVAEAGITSTTAPANPGADVPALPSKYRRQWWPGGERPGNLPPLALIPGAAFAIPNIRLSKGPLYRVSGRFQSGECGSDDRFQVSVTVTYGRSLYRLAYAEVPCRSRFTVVNLAPGEYDIGASGKVGGQEVRFFQTAIVVDRDLEIDLPASPPITVHGRLEFPDGFPADLKSKLSFRGVFDGKGTFGDLSGLIAEDGSFTLAARSQGTIDLQLTGLPALSPYYLSEMLYNGSAVRDGFWELNPRAMTQTLDVKLSDKGATLRGKVLLKGDPVPNASLIAVPWPVRWKGAFPVEFFCAGTEDGTFNLAGLPPDSYHVLAVPTSAWRSTLQKPGALAALAEPGTSVDMGPGASQDVSLDLTWVPSDSYTPF